MHIRQLRFVQFLMGESSEAMLEEGKIAQKRIKFQEITEKVEEDGISALPECLLLEILSRLPSTKAAVRTGTLSKRWQHLWTWVPTLIFTHSDLTLPQSLEKPSSYALLVDKTLNQCRRLKLKKFELHTYYDIQFELQYNNWIRYAMSCNVEELNLDFLATRASLLLDQSVFINSCTTDMRLSGFKLNPIGAIHWENLRSLCITWVNVDTDLLVNIFNGSPLLETLVLTYCYHPTWLNIAPVITSDSSDSDESESDIIEIINPTNSPLNQCRQLNLKKFKVYTNYDFEFQPQINNWIRYAIRCNVKELNLYLRNYERGYKFELDKIVFTSSCFTELTLNGCVLDPVGAISWKNLRSLCITYQDLDEDLIENILSGSPVLETLELDYCYGYKRLDITSKSVKNLVLSGYDNVPYGESEVDIIEINAPNILSVTIQGRFCLWRVLLRNVSSLVKANLNYYCAKLKHRELTREELEQEMLKGHIMNLRHVKELEIGLRCSKVVSCLQTKGFVLPSNAKLTGVR